MRLISGTLKPTPLPWLPVLSNIEPPALRRKEAADKFLNKISAHDDWPIFDDVFNPPHLRLTSRKPIWRDAEPTNIPVQWQADWLSASVINHHLVSDPNLRVPGFDLPRKHWSLLNRFRTGKGHCASCHKTWDLATSDLCSCGEIQTMSHIVDTCPLTKLDGGLVCLHSADERAVRWLTSYDT